MQTFNNVVILCQLWNCYVDVIIKLLGKATHPEIKEISFRRFDKTEAGLIVSERKFVFLFIYTPSRSVANIASQRIKRIVKNER